MMTLREIEDNYPIDLHDTQVRRVGIDCHIQKVKYKAGSVRLRKKGGGQ